MEASVFTGVQASGKSSFYKERFFRTHLRISLVQLRTRRREAALFEACLKTGQPLVVDNTNPSREDRARYVVAARRSGFRVIGYYFHSEIEASLRRNRGRSGPERIPDKGVLGTYGRVELPTLGEGFDELYFVRLTDEGFEVQERLVPVSTSWQ